MKIPKIIHYVWVGETIKPKMIRKCIVTWKKHLPDYKFIEWNEDNFDINSHPFVRAAYKAQKWAFVSDYIRAWALHKYGGIYLDTDVFVIENLDSLLYDKCFVGFEKEGYPFTAVFGCIKGHDLVKDILNYYNNLTDYQFNFENNNTISVSELLIKKYNCSTKNGYQNLKKGIKVYPDYILCNPSLESKTVHLFLGSWLERNNFKRWKHDFLRSKLKSKKSIWMYTKFKQIKKWSINEG